MGKFRVVISLPGEYVFRGVRARDPLDALEKVEMSLLEIDACFGRAGALPLPAPRRLELDFPLEAFVEEVSSSGKVIREFGLEPHPWKVIS